MFSNWTLPPSYYLDASDPDVIILRRQEDGVFVAVFSAQGASKEGILAATTPAARARSLPRE